MLACHDVPKMNARIVASRRKPQAVGGERNSPDVTAVALQNMAATARVNSPSNPYKLNTEFDEAANLDKRSDLRDRVRCERHKSMKAQV